MAIKQQLAMLQHDADAYWWQEQYRLHQNESYGNALQKMYIAVAGAYKGSAEELAEHIDALPSSYLKQELHVYELGRSFGRKTLCSS